MKLVVGLGNPGEKYVKTRHNVGFMVLDRLIKSGEIRGEFSFEKKFDAEVAQWMGNGEKVIFAKPMTFMNLSGKAVREIANFFKIDPSEVLVIHDDLDIPFGEIRVRQMGRSGGHNGLASIIEQLGTEEIGRVKIGIGRPPENWSAEKYVLEEFGPDEAKDVPMILEKVSKLVIEGLRSDKLDNESFSIYNKI